METKTVNDVIARTAVSSLCSYLAKASETPAAMAGEAIYQALEARLAQKPAAQEALTDLEQAPADPDLQAALRVQIKKLLAEDEAFATQFLCLLLTTQLSSLPEQADKDKIDANLIKQVAGHYAKQIGQLNGDLYDVHPQGTIIQPKSDIHLGQGLTTSEWNLLRQLWDDWRKSR